MAGSVLKTSSILFFLTLLTNTVLAQHIDKNYVIQKALAYQKIDSVFEKQDSLNSLANALSRLNTAKVDSLFITLDSIVSENTLKMAFYREWATSLSRQGEVTRSKNLRKKGLELAIEAKHVVYEFNYTNSLASLYVNLSKADSVAYYNIKTDKLIQQNIELLGNAKWQVSYTYAMMYELLGNTKKHKQELEKSWEEINAFENHESRGFLIYILLDYYRQTKDDLNQAKFTELFIEHYNTKKLTTPAYHFPIKTILLKDDSKESLDNLKRINKLSDSLNNLNSLSQTATVLSKKLIEIGRANEAIPYLKNAIKRLRAANYLVGNSVEIELLQQAYQSIGDYKNAYQTLALQKALEDSLRSARMLQTIADYEVKYETEKKDAALQKLSFEAEQASQQKNVYTIALASVVIILGILAFFLYKNKKQKNTLAKQKKMLEITVDEKNVLLKETHHRVKNSFQIVSSLLYLQSETIKDKEAQTAMKEAQNRVRSMVLIHQRLYSKDQLVGISADEYLIDLVVDIFESHQAETEKITYTIDATPIVLGIETTTSLGLILNELITNVIKHAFPKNSKKGTMHISLQLEEETLVLQVKDSGKGMPVDIGKGSFGIELITALSKKLKSTLVFSENNPKGTIATLRINRFNVM